MRVTAFDIRRDGHPISGGGDTLLTVPRIEMAEGKMFISDADRLYVLALLLESVGVDAAIRLGSPKVWHEAINQIHAVDE
jgi:hypothetical protein